MCIRDRSYTEETLRRRVAKELKVPPSVIAALRVYRRSVDARHKENVVFQITVDVTLGTGETAAASRCPGATLLEPPARTFQMCIRDRHQRAGQTCHFDFQAVFSHIRILLSI